MGTRYTPCGIHSYPRPVTRRAFCEAHHAEQAVWQPPAESVQKRNGRRVSAEARARGRATQRARGQGLAAINRAGIDKQLAWHRADEAARA